MAASGSGIVQSSGLRPSYASGYASRLTGQLAYPRLWDGVVFAACPSLGATGSTLRDLSGRHNHGTLTNTTLSTVWQPDGLDLDGTDDYVSVPDSEVFNVTNITLAMWYIHDAYSAGEHATLMAKGDPETSGQWSLQILVPGSGSDVIFRVGGSTAIQAVTQSVTGELTFIALTKSGSDYVLYVNGVSDATGSSANSIDNSEQIQIGYRNVGYPARFNGTIDDVLIYDRALSPNEIQTLYRLGPGGIYQRQQSVITTSAAPATDNVAGSGIIRVKSESRPSFASGIATHDQSAQPRLWDGIVGAWCPSLGATGSTLRDLSGRHNHGTLTNTTLSTVWQPDGLDLDGINDYVDLNSSVSDIGGLATGSLSLWFKSDRTDTGSPDAKAVFAVSQASSSNDFASLRVGNCTSTNATESLQFFVREAGVNRLDMQVRLGHDEFLDDIWHHIVLIVDGVDNKIVIDGIERFVTFGTGSSTSQYFTNISSPDAVTVGGRELNSTTDVHWDGELDGVSVYSRGLSYAEASDLYRLGPGGIYQRQQSVITTSAAPATDNVSASGIIRVKTPSQVRPSFASGIATHDQSAQPQLWDGIVGAWCPSLGATGSTLRDLSGRHNHGTLTNMDPATDWLVDGLDFDGTDDRADCGNGDSLQITGAFTLSAWVNLDSTAAYNVLVSKYQSVGNLRAYWLAVDASGFAEVRISEFGSSGIDFKAGSTALSTDTWYHVVGVYVPSTSLEVFVDGVSDGINTSGISPSVFNTSQSLLIGGQGNGTLYTNGTIDDVLIYDRALSPNEIQTLYRLGPAGIYQRQQSVITTSAAPATDNVAGSGIIRVKTPSQVRPSFASGIATHDQSAYPRLWDGIVGSWCPSLGATGSQLRDLSGRHNHGTLTSMTLSDAWADPKGLTFDGTNDYVNCGNFIDQPTVMTWSVWFKPNAWDDNDFVIEKGNLFALGQHSSIVGANGGFSFRHGGTWKSVDFAASPTLGEWVYAVAVLNGSALELFVDGDSAASRSDMGGAAPSSFDVNIGGRDTAFPFDGTIDDVLIYDRALTAPEIQTLYRLGPAGIYQRQQSVITTSAAPATDNVAGSGIVRVRTPSQVRPSFASGIATHDQSAYPRLWDGIVGSWCPSLGATGSQLRDLSGRHNHGTLTNMDPATDWLVDGLDFDGSNDEVSIPLSVDEKSVITLSIWAKASSTSTGGTNDYLFSFKEGALNNGVDIGQNDSNWRFDLSTSSTNSFNLLSSGSVTTDWTYLALTYDGVTLKCYENAVEVVNTAVAAGSGIKNAYGAGSIGSLGEGSFGWAGRLNDAIVYDRALTAPEIQTLYRLGPAGIYQRQQSVITTSAAPATDNVAGSGVIRVKTPSQVRPSFASGIATHDQSAQPRLWDGIVGAWCPSLGATGSQLRDLSGRHNHGTLTNTSLSSVWQPDGLHLDGINDYVALPSGSQPANTPLTISMWLNHSDSAATSQVVYSSDTSNTDISIGSVQSLNAWTVGWRGVSTTYRKIASADAPSTGEWWHLCYTLDAGNNGKLYANADGTLDTSATEGEIWFHSTNGKVNIGDRVGPTSVPFAGAIDGVSIYNRALTAPEIQTLYRLGPGGIYQRQLPVMLNSAPTVSPTLYNRMLLGVGL